ncbi:MAG: hypothetical protein JHC33_09075 [Ignisphaera sp.]|nr:hypothetical protein [Ignisphaera sp.]
MSMDTMGQAFAGGVNSFYKGYDAGVQRVDDREDRAIKLKREAETYDLKLKEANRQDKAQQAFYEQSGLDSYAAKTADLENQIKELKDSQTKSAGLMGQKSINSLVLADDSLGMVEPTKNIIGSNPILKQVFGTDWSVPNPFDPSHVKNIQSYLSMNGLDTDDDTVYKYMSSGLVMMDNNGKPIDMLGMMAATGSNKLLTPEEKAKLDTLIDSTFSGKKLDRIGGQEGEEDTFVPVDSEKSSQAEKPLNYNNPPGIKEQADSANAEKAQLDSSVNAEKARIDEQVAGLEQQKEEAGNKLNLEMVRRIAGYKDAPTEKQTRKLQVEVQDDIVKSQLEAEGITIDNPNYSEAYQTKFKTLFGSGSDKRKEYEQLMEIVNDPKSSKDQKAQAQARLKKLSYIAPQSVSSQSQYDTRTITNRDSNGRETTEIVKIDKLTGNPVGSSVVGSKAPSLSNKDTETIDSINNLKTSLNGLKELNDPKFSRTFGPLDNLLDKAASMAGLETEDTAKRAEVMAKASKHQADVMSMIRGMGSVSNKDMDALSGLIISPSDTPQEVKIKIREFSSKVLSMAKTTADRFNKTNPGVINKDALQEPPALNKANVKTVPGTSTTYDVAPSGVINIGGGQLPKGKRVRINGSVYINIDGQLKKVGN